MTYSVMTHYFSDKDILGKIGNHTIVETWDNMDFETMRYQLIDVLDVLTDFKKNPIVPTFQEVESRLGEFIDDSEMIQREFKMKVAAYDVYMNVMNEMENGSGSISVNVPELGITLSCKKVES